MTRSSDLPPREIKHTDGGHLDGAAHHASLDATHFQGSKSYTQVAALEHPAVRHDGVPAGAAHLDVPPAPYPPIKPADVGVSRREGAAAAPGAEATPGAGDRTVIHSQGDKIADGQNPNLTVRLGDLNQPTNADNIPATFRVTADGNVLDSNGQPVSKDIAFANGVPKEIVMQVDRPADFDQRPKAEQDAYLQQQQARVFDFVNNSLKPAMEKSVTVAAAPESPAAPLDKPEAPVVAPQQHFSGGERRASGRVNSHGNMPNDHHGSMTRRQADSYFPQGAAPQPGEQPERVARRDTLASLYNPDKDDPYGTIRRQPDQHSYSVGRYGHSYNHFNNVMHRAIGRAMASWPQDILDELGHPPDWSKLAEILKKHPELMKGIQQNVAEQMKDGQLPKELGDKFATPESAGKFGNFVSKLKGDGEAPSKAELAENAGKDVQEAMARDTVDRAIRAGKSPAEMALAQHLGVEPDQLTDAQKNDPKNLEYMQAANKLYALSAARQQDGPTASKNPNDRIDWMTSNRGDAAANVSDISPELGQKMAAWAKNWAEHNRETVDGNGIGNCTRLARKLYEAMGVMKLPRMSGVDQGNYLRSTGLFREVSKDEARAGDFLYRGWAYRRSPVSGRNLGDSAVVVGNDGHGNVYGVNGASNHVFRVTTRGGYYTPEVYLRPTAKFERLLQANKQQ